MKEFQYCIEGPAEFDGCREYISEKIRAYSEYQAFWLLARRLEKQKEQNVYLGSCRIYVVKVFPPDKTIDVKREKRKVEQQVLYFF
jgi:hypothetical protein